MTKEKYLLLCEAQGMEPVQSHMPLELADFPEIVSVAATIFNNLRDTYIPGEYPVYIGKELSSLNVLFEIYEVEARSERRLILQIINILDSEAVAAAKARLADIQRKGKGGKGKLPSVQGGSRT